MSCFRASSSPGQGEKGPDWHELSYIPRCSPRRIQPWVGSRQGAGNPGAAKRRCSTEPASLESLKMDLTFLLWYGGNFLGNLVCRVFRALCFLRSSTYPDCLSTDLIRGWIVCLSKWWINLYHTHTVDKNSIVAVGNEASTNKLRHQPLSPL